MNAYLEQQQQVPSRISDYRKECERLSGMLQEWPVVVTQIGAVERKQESMLRNRSARAIEEMSIDVRNSLKRQMAEVQNFKGKILEQFTEIECSYRGIFDYAVEISEDDRSCSSLVGGRGQVMTHENSRFSTSGIIASGAQGRDNLGRSSSEREINVEMGEKWEGVAVEKKDERKDVERKKRVLVGVEVEQIGKMEEDCSMCDKAVYNWETREMMCFKAVIGVIKVFGVNEANDKLELKRTMQWRDMRGLESILRDICMEQINNLMYGVVLQLREGEVKRVEELDQWTLNKESNNGEIDTGGLLNGERVFWYLVSRRDTLALLIIDQRSGYCNGKWDSVAIYTNSVRRVHNLSHLDNTVIGVLSVGGSVLANETTLLLSCGEEANKVAVISLPPQSHHNQTSTSASSPSSSANSTVNVKFVTLTNVNPCYGGHPLIWTPSGEPLQGYLWTGKLTTQVYKVDLETLLKNVKKRKKTIQQVHEILPLENRITAFCLTDDSTIFAFGENKVDDSYEHLALLLKLDFTST